MKSWVIPARRVSGQASRRNASEARIVDRGDRVLAVLGRLDELERAVGREGRADALGALGDLARGHLDAVDGLGPDLVAEVDGRVDDAHAAILAAPGPRVRATQPSVAAPSRIAAATSAGR